MKKKKNMGVKILASLALIGIIISIIGTAILVITSGGYSNGTPEITSQQLQEIVNPENIQVETTQGENITLTPTTSSGVTQ